MAVKRITFYISDEEDMGKRSPQDILEDVEAEVLDMDPDFIAPMPNDRCIDTNLNTRSIFKSINRHLRPCDRLWVSGVTQWPQFTRIDNNDMAWFKERSR